MWPFNASWKDIASDKQGTRAAALRTASELLPSHAAYLSASAPEIVSRIKDGQWTASEVLEAYIARAAVAHTETNCITEVLFETARKEAQALDQHFRDTMQIKGPLHGVPVSFKDIFDISGYDSTMGHTGNACQPASVDADLVRTVREAGGVPFVKTNISQCMMFFECVNPVWGRSTNPHNQDFTCGGSTGGEGALLAMDGSALGWGSDVGGSLRIPASYCGVYSLKPGFGRVPTLGGREGMPGFEAVRTVCGPLGRSVSDLELACRVVFGHSSENYDPAPIPFRDVQLPAKLRFGYYKSDGFVKASPVCQRAVMETVEALRREGHECVEIELPDPGKPMDLFMQLISSDGNQTLFSPIGKDPRQLELATVALGPSMFGWMRSLASWIISKLLGDPMFSSILYGARTKTVAEFWRVTDETRQYARKFNKEVWEKHNLDGIIAPVQALPALPHRSVALIAAVSAATILYNVVDSPVGVVPVTKVEPGVDDVAPEWLDSKVGSGHGSPLLEYLLYNKSNYSIYNAKKMAGLPVGVQVVGKKWEEEKVIEMMKVIDDALGKRKFGPGVWRPTRN